jgi:hypothetical protein
MGASDWKGLSNGSENNKPDCKATRLRSHSYVTEPVRISDSNMVVLYITHEVCLILPYKMKHYRKMYIWHISHLSQTTNAISPVRYYQYTSCPQWDTQTWLSLLCAGCPLCSCRRACKASFADTKKILWFASFCVHTFSSLTRKSTARSMCCARTCKNTLICDYYTNTKLRFLGATCYKRM